MYLIQNQNQTNGVLCCCRAEALGKWHFISIFFLFLSADKKRWFENHALHHRYFSLTHSLLINDVVLLTLIAEWISERVFGASGELRDHAQHDTVPAERLRHSYCQGHKHNLRLVCHLRRLVHLRRLSLRFLLGSIPRHFYWIILQPSCKSTQTIIKY